MKRTALLLAAALLHFAPGARSAPEQAGLIPLPSRVEQQAGQWKLAPNASISYTPVKARTEAQLLAEQLRRATGFSIPVRPGKSGTIVLSIRPASKKEQPDGAYQLQVTPRGVRIEAADGAGLFYGGQTLRQLLPPAIYSTEKTNTTWTAPCVTIEDRPRFAWRGLMLDSARHFFTKEEVESLIDTMASLKLNVLHWHLTDDQGWRIEIKKYPKLTEVGAWRAQTLVGHWGKTKKNPQYDGKRYGGFYTQDDIREIVAYAAERHITIVPEIDMPGHMQAAVAAYPELGCTGKQVPVKTEWGVSVEILSPEEKTIEFCKNVLAEVMELFPSQYIHIGGDEARKDLWNSSPRIRQLLEERGLKDMDEMQSWFTRQINDYLNAHGRKLIGWDEICAGGLPPGAAVMWWRPKARPQVERAAKEGHEIVVASYSHLYFDYYQGKDKKQEPLAIGGFLPLRKVYNFEPQDERWGEGARNVLGPQAQIWTEYIDTFSYLQYMTFPRACALAEIAWSAPKKKSYDQFIKRLSGQLERFDAAGINYRRPEELAPEKNDGSD